MGLAQGCDLSPNMSTTVAPAVLTTTAVPVANSSVNSLTLLADWWCNFGVYFAVAGDGEV
jgi:hypothetical protein